MTNNILFKDCFRLVKPTEEQLKIFRDSDVSAAGRRALHVWLEATHSAIINRNNRVYIPSRMRDGAANFLKGKKAPILKHHDTDSDPVGKIVSAEYIDTIPQELTNDPNIAVLLDSEAPIRKQVRTIATLMRNKSFQDENWRGLGYLKVGAVIIDPTTIDQIESGLFDAVSVGFGSNHDFCSICFADWLDSADGICEHIPGKIYKDEESGVERRCQLIPGDMLLRETSLVNFDADPFTSIMIGGMDSVSINEEVRSSLIDKRVFPSQMTWEVRDSEEAAEMKIDLKDGASIELNDEESKIFEEFKKHRPEAEVTVLADYAKKVAVLRQEDGKFPLQDEAELDEGTYLLYSLEDLETDGKELDADAIYADMEQEFAAMVKEGLLKEEVLKDAVLNAEQRKKLGDKTFCGPNRSFPVPDCAHVTAARRLIGRYKGPGSKATILACVSRKAKALGCGSSSSDSAPPAEAPLEVPPTAYGDMTEEELRGLFHAIEKVMVDRNLTVKRECSECATHLKNLEEAQKTNKEIEDKLTDAQNVVVTLRDELRHEFSSHKMLIDEYITLGLELKATKANYGAVLSVASGQKDKLDEAKAEFLKAEDFDTMYKTFVDSVDLDKILAKMNDGTAKKPEGTVADPTISNMQDSGGKFSKLDATSKNLILRMKEMIADDKIVEARELFKRMTSLEVLSDQITWDDIISQTSGGGE